MNLQKERYTTDYLGLYAFVSSCFDDLPIASQHVIDKLLSVDDESDIINDQVTSEKLTSYIQVWIDAGRPDYSGK